jgi:hypothetical protein
MVAVAIAINGMSQSVPFIVRGHTKETASLEVRADGALREKYSAWLLGVTGDRAAA